MVTVQFLQDKLTVLSTPGLLFIQLHTSSILEKIRCILAAEVPWRVTAYSPDQHKWPQGLDIIKFVALLQSALSLQKSCVRSYIYRKIY